MLLFYWLHLEICVFKERPSETVCWGRGDHKYFKAPDSNAVLKSNITSFKRHIRIQSQWKKSIQTERLWKDLKNIWTEWVIYLLIEKLWSLRRQEILRRLIVSTASVRLMRQVWHCHVQKLHLNSMWKQQIVHSCIINAKCYFLYSLFSTS